jgi:predicted PurR-regulated permease PerM
MSAITRPRTIFLSIAAIATALLLVVANAVLLPFVLALVIAYVLTPAVAWVERRRFPRALAILTVYVAVLGTLYGSIRLMAPRIGHELVNLRHELPSMVSEINDKWVPEVMERMSALGVAPPPLSPEPAVEEPAIVAHPLPDGTFALDVGSGFVVEPTRHGGYVVEPAHTDKPPPFDLNRIIADAVGKSFAYAQKNALELARIGRDIVASVSRVIFVFAMTLMLGAYMMLTRERLVGFFRSLVRPSSRGEFARLLARIDRGLSGVVRGQLIICVVNGVLSAVGFAFIGLKYWPVLSLIATVFSLVPIFGSIASAVPAVALGLTQSLGTAAFVLLWIIGIHQLEANVLNPKIMGDQAKIHPVLVIFSLLVGEHFFHVMGALLAVPCMSVAQSVFIHFRQAAEDRDPEFAGEPRASTMPPPR